MVNNHHLRRCKLKTVFKSAKLPAGGHDDIEAPGGGGCPDQWDISGGGVVLTAPK